MSRSEISREMGGAAVDTPGGLLGTLRSKNRWTLATLVVLLVFTLAGAFYAISSQGQSAFVATVAVVVSLVLLRLMWNETPRTVGIAVVVGLAATAFFVGVTLVVGPSGAYTVASEIGYDLIYLLVPITAYLSYRQLPKT